MGRGLTCPPTRVVTSALMRGRTHPRVRGARTSDVILVQSRILTLARGLSPMNVERGDVMQGARECPGQRGVEYRNRQDHAYHLPHSLMNDVSIPCEKSHMQILCSEARSVSQCTVPGNLEHDVTWSSPHETICTVSRSTVTPDCTGSQGHDRRKQRAGVPWCNRSQRKRFCPCGPRRDRR